jgi:arylsulfatase A-like enzyme
MVAGRRDLPVLGLFLRLMPSIPQTPRRPARLVALAAAVAALLAIGLLASRPAANAALGDPLAPPPPNIVLITTDDQPASTMTRAAMPNLFKRMVDQGSSFDDYIVTTPLCCPSRATLLTGQYGHNNGVLRNDYALLEEKRNVLPIWLRRAGYATAHVGKFLNQFGAFAGNERAVAPGWDLWFTQFEKKAYYEWDASKNGKRKSYGSEDADHLTEVTNTRAARWTKKLVKQPQPFFMQLDYYAPHGAVGRDPRCLNGPEPAPADVGRGDGLGLPNPPSFNEADVSDKPDFIKIRPRLGPGLIAATTQRYRCTIESLFSVDRGIEAVFKKVEQAGELDRTVFIFTSDNGYFFGEHRIFLNKVYPYEEALKVPLVARVPASLLGPKARRNGAPETVSAPVDQIDVTATIMDFAGAQPCTAAGDCRTLDGRSLRPLLNGRRPGWSRGRTLLAQLGGIRTCGVVPTERGLKNYYDAIRTKRYTYVELNRVNKETGECDRPEYELYDLKQDPYQLRNRAVNPAVATPSALQLGLAARLDALRDCSGVAGRDAPTGRPFCE